MDEKRILELKKMVSLLKWDLGIVSNNEVRARKQLLLKRCEEELEELRILS